MLINFNNLFSIHYPELLLKKAFSISMYNYGVFIQGENCYMKKGKIYTLIDGSERNIIIDKGTTLREDVYRVGIREGDLLYM
jgi:hypothetical protein